MKIIVAFLIGFALLSVGCSNPIYYCTMTQYKSIMACVPEDKLEQAMKEAQEK